MSKLRGQSKPAWIGYMTERPGAEMRLICFPYAGGSAAVFRTWPRSLPESVELLPVEYPGRGKRLRETPIPYMEDMVNALYAEMEPWLTGSYAFWGHSMGALVAFEMARLLADRGETAPKHLFVSARRAPHLPLKSDPVLHFSDERLLKELRGYQGTPPEILENEELLKLILPIVRADFSVIETYKYAARPPLPCPITCFGGESDASVSPEELLPWREQTNENFDHRIFPGDHFFIRSVEEDLLRHIAQTLEDTMSQNRL